jgi:hypothetical protein
METITLFISLLLTSYLMILDGICRFRIFPHLLQKAYFLTKAKNTIH